jgi:hypothetical protein
MNISSYNSSYSHKGFVILLIQLKNFDFEIKTFN